MLHFNIIVLTLTIARSLYRIAHISIEELITWTSGYITSQLQY